MKDDPEIVALQRKAIQAVELLEAAVRMACPGHHEYVQHRDRLPPWCEACGRDAVGDRVGRIMER